MRRESDRRIVAAAGSGGDRKKSEELVDEALGAVMAERIAREGDSAVSFDTLLRELGTRR